MTSRKTARWVILLLGFAAYAPALPTRFLYDDHLLIESNPTIRSWSVENLKQDFGAGVFHTSGQEVDFYRPLQNLSTRIEYTLWKLRPFPYHLTNLLLHLGNGLLLFELLLVIGFDLRVAGLAGSLFVVHPIIVEDLLMVSGRGELLGFFFMTASLLFFFRERLYRWLWSLTAFMAALLSKESAVVTPLLLTAILYLKKEPRVRYRATLPFMGVLVLYGVLRTQALGRVGQGLMLPHPLRFMIVAFPEVLLRYARILLFPIDLHTDRLLISPGSYWPLATCSVTLVLFGVFIRGPRWLRFSVLWFIITLLPKTPLMMTGSFMSDHWAYPSLVSVALILAQGLNVLWKSPRRLWAHSFWVLLIFLEVSGVYWNITMRNTDEKLYRSALRYPTTFTMKYNLAIVLLRQHRATEALPYLEQLQAAFPTDNQVAQALALAQHQLHSAPPHP